MMKHFAEFHDTQLGAFARSGITGRIELVYMPVFEQCGPDEFDVWAYEGELVLEGVTEWPPTLPDDDDSVCSVDGLPNLIEVALDAGTLVRRLERVGFTVELCSGQEFRLGAGSIHLRLTQKGALLERWTGPLWKESAAGAGVLFLPPLSRS